MNLKLLAMISFGVIAFPLYAQQVNDSSWVKKTFKEATIDTSLSDVDTLPIHEPNSVRQLFEERVSVYPNPASQYVTIDLQLDANVPVYIYDSNGKMMMCLYAGMGKTVLDLSKLRNGFYHIAIYALPDCVIRKTLQVY